MRIHLLALPNAQTTRAYSLDGFSQATIRFAKVLKLLNIPCFLYASEENEAPCDELITVITKEEISSLLSMGPDNIPDWGAYQYARIDETSPLFQLSNSRTALEIAKRKQPKDIICQIGGSSQAYVSMRHPDLPTVEYSIGYDGSFSNYRIFESNAWMHETYGRMGIRDGRFYDDVIPLPFDVTEFHPKEKPDDYFVYCGRFIERKGVAIACQAAREAGVKLLHIGHGDTSLISYGQFIGTPSANERNDILSRAIACFTPTLYLEPFNCVTIEAQLGGTPVIATPWGGFMDTIEEGKTGFRCHYLGEFVDAIKKCPSLDRNYIASRARNLYSIEATAKQYARYFFQLEQLWESGWNSLDLPKSQ